MTTAEAYDMIERCDAIVAEAHRAGRADLVAKATETRLGILAWIAFANTPKRKWGRA